jgi:hypothetical protein
MIDAQFKNLAVRRKKNKKEKKLCGKFTRALLAHQIFSFMKICHVPDRPKASFLDCHVQTFKKIKF